jgi:Berberine and berberine like/FAD binding domain
LQITVGSPRLLQADANESGLGGKDNAVVIDMKNLQQFTMDNSTWHATMGAGMLLQDVTNNLYNAGGRAIAHGTCPQVGLSGHGTIGGLGPTSRMWGSCLDHIDSVEVVLANSTITTASWTENPDIFFALKGAGASFGVITSFTVHTEPAPGEVVQYSFGFQFDDYATMAESVKGWQAFIAQPSLSRKFASDLTVFSFGLIVSGTYFGPQSEFDQLNFGSIFPDNGNKSVVVMNDWLGVVSNWAQSGFEALGGGIPSSFYSKSLAFTPQNMPSNETIDNLFQYLDTADKGTIAWMVIFDLQGGATNDIPQNKTAYAHRDSLYWLQSYGISLTPPVSNTTLAFLDGINDLIQKANPSADFGAYPGYVDPRLPDGQQAYWGSNLPRLESIKRQVDPKELFWNPQSVRPASS